MPTPLPVQLIRLANLKKLIKQHGGVAQLASAMGMPGPARLHHVLAKRGKGKRSIGERSARDIEKRLNLPGNFMDVDHDKTEPPPIGSIAPLARVPRITDTRNLTVIQTRRVKNLEALIKTHRGSALLGKACGFASQSRISHLRYRKPMGEKTARSMEKHLGLSAGWMDRDHDVELPAYPMGRFKKNLGMAFDVISILGPDIKKLSPPKMEFIITHVIELAKLKHRKSVDPEIVVGLAMLTQPD